MDDINRAQIGQKREVAHEIYKHSKIPKTNLPPMNVKDRNRGKTVEYEGSGLGGALIILFVILMIAIALFLLFQ